MTPTPRPLTRDELEAQLLGWELVLSPEAVQMLEEGQYNPETGKFRRLRVVVDDG